MSGQRTWSRVEDPKTYRGHALTATIGGATFYAWENADGRWSLRRNGGRPTVYPDWGAARRSAEGPTSNPSPMAAMATPTGDFRCDRANAVSRAVGWGTLARAPKCDRYGNVWLMVRPGFGGTVRRAIRRARLDFPVQIMEAPA